MSLSIDIIILVLLAGVLAYAYLVDRRVRNLVAVLRELEPMVGKFSDAVDKSEDSVTAMKFVTDSLRRSPQRTEAREPRETEAAASFHSVRQDRAEEQARASGIASVSGKADMVRSFFDTVQGRKS
jgi:hypothetical protein